MTLGTLDIDALRGASREKRTQVIRGLRQREDPVQRMRDLLVEGAERAGKPQVATATGSPWVALANPSGSVVWYRRQNVDGDPILDVLVETVAALHGDGVLDAAYGPPELPV